MFLPGSAHVSSSPSSAGEQSSSEVIQQTVRELQEWHRRAAPDFTLLVRTYQGLLSVYSQAAGSCSGAEEQQ
ncbi:hypothetical protein CDG81_13610 [Actinopolyspora erythraea]|uniref:Uncharacterized protein n=1 Tax=Actinopolyspora erythraea TaxID=414996 RepID=A0A099D402_9ACTN|nr:hypothetical protein CDG81_13610 [Actinopolyspora erythraea]KGI80666.1 hypothetical protein IL38_16195 [Actinopolyspora erythraea]